MENSMRTPDNPHLFATEYHNFGLTKTSGEDRQGVVANSDGGSTSDIDINLDIAAVSDAKGTIDVSAVDCRNYKEVGDCSGTLQAKNKPGWSLNYIKPLRNGYIVRRLTPTECERLQGFPDGWTRFGHDDKEISDTKRYQALGNSVAIPCVAYILGGIAAKFWEEEQARTRR